MQLDFTVVIPFYNGHKHIGQLLKSLPDEAEIIVVDDKSDVPYQTNDRRVKVIRLNEKGYFAGACSTGWENCKSDVLILNQDTWFDNYNWLDELYKLRKEYALIGDGVLAHPAWPKGYVQGTFMYVRRDAIDAVGPMNQVDYPLWGATAEWQLRMCRKGFKAHPVYKLPWFSHIRRDTEAYGSSISDLLYSQPEKRGWFIRTPPAISVIMTCHNYGRYLPDAINSLIGGPTSLGQMAGQTFQSFEVIIVNDVSSDNTREIGMELADDWKGIHYIEMQRKSKKNLPHGMPAAINEGVRHSYGKFITILSADDMRESYGLEELYRVVESNPTKVAYDDCMIFNFGERRRRFVLPEYDFNQIIYKNCMHSGIMFSRKAWENTGGYPELFKDGREDWAFNVALGIKGYCGQKVDVAGYLYRREEQNRTTRNSGPGWQQYYVNQMKKTFPTIYGGYRPMGCCGSRNPSTKPPKPKGGSPDFQVGAEGMTLLEYVGLNHGKQQFVGPFTKTPYYFGLSKKFGFVDNRDLKGTISGIIGLLELVQGGRYLFKVTKQPEPIDADIESNPTANVGDNEIEATPAIEVEEKIPTTKIVEVSDPTVMTITGIKNHVKENKLDKAELESMLTIEENGKGRAGAIKVLNEAIADVTSPF